MKKTIEDNSNTNYIKQFSIVVGMITNIHGVSQIGGCWSLSMQP